MTQINSPFLNLSHPIPFNAFSTKHVVGHINQLLNEAKQDLKDIETNEAINYETVLGRLDRLGENLESCLTVYSQLESLLGTAELREAMRKAQPQVSAFYATIPFSAPLYQKLKLLSLSDSMQNRSLSEKRYLEQTLLSFQRNGAEASSDTKLRLEELEKELAELTMNFAKNVVEETDEFEWLCTNEELLAGLPESAIANAKQSAQSKKLDGYRFTLQGPSYIAIMTYCDDRSIREHFYRSYATRAWKGERDNQYLIHKILNLRQEKADLLDYQDISDLLLASRMVKNGKKAKSFVDELIEKTVSFSNKEHESLVKFAQEQLDWTEEVQPWDLSYIAEKQKKAECGFDAEVLKPYFELQNVMQGMFKIVERLYQVEVEPCEDISKWHQDVMTFYLKEQGETIGVFYADLFPREGKQGGAWMCPLLYKNESQPHVGLICANFTPPVNGVSLLTHREVETLFHEFGHLLHHLLTTVKIRSQAGTNVAWDFVELPSQIMENWCWEREALDIFARHYQSGEPLPNELFEQLKNTQKFRMASGQMRQLTFAEIDLKLHREYQFETDGPV